MDSPPVRARGKTEAPAARVEQTPTTEDALSAGSARVSKPASTFNLPGPNKSPAGNEPWQILKKELGTLHLGSRLESLVAPASLMLPFSTTELSLLGVACSASGLAAATREADRIRRMLRVLSAHLGAMAHTLSAPMMKPYNPVLGEVLAARGGELAEAGSGGASAWRAVIEQVSLNPPLTAFHVEGYAGARWMHYGSSGSSVFFLGNTVEVRIAPQPGGTFLTLEDGTEEQYRVKSLPSMCLRNILGIGRPYCEWVGDLEVEGVSSGLVGWISFQAAQMFDAASAHRVVGAVSSGDAKLATVLNHIAGAWTSRVVATAADGHDELELLPALPGGAARPTGLVHLPQPLPYELPTHSLIREAWPLHPHAIWSELTTALRARDWAAARAAKRRVEEALRAKAAEMAEAETTCMPMLFEEAAGPPGANAWILRAGALDRAFNPVGVLPNMVSDDTLPNMVSDGTLPNMVSDGTLLSCNTPEDAAEDAAVHSTATPSSSDHRLITTDHRIETNHMTSNLTSRRTTTPTEAAVVRWLKSQELPAEMERRAERPSPEARPSSACIHATPSSSARNGARPRLEHSQLDHSQLGHSREVMVGLARRVLETRYVTIELPVDGGKAFDWTVDDVDMTFIAPEGTCKGDEHEFTFTRIPKPSLVSMVAGFVIGIALGFVSMHHLHLLDRSDACADALFMNPRQCITLSPPECRLPPSNVICCQFVG